MFLFIYLFFIFFIFCRCLHCRYCFVFFINCLIIDSPSHKQTLPVDVGLDYRLMWKNRRDVQIVRRHSHRIFEIMKLGIWVGFPTRIILRSGPNSETPPDGRHLEFQNGRHSEDINLPNSKPMIDRNVLFVASPHLYGQGIS